MIYNAKLSKFYFYMQFLSNKPNENLDIELLCKIDNV